jgi:6-carboxyhexanoate--CoA ligase
MGRLWSVRMRASDARGAHISGAEDIVAGHEVDAAIIALRARAMAHPRGKPARITITVEAIEAAPERVRALAVCTLECASPAIAREAMTGLLMRAGVSARAAEAGLGLVRSAEVMRGASLMHALTGKRLEPDRTRGVRASRMGYTPRALAATRQRLGPHGIDTQTVREALALATKIAHGPGVVAEVCVSDDPDYTTGYVAAPGLGYVRVPHAKPQGSRAGGRVVYTAPGADVCALVHWLENASVLVSAAPVIRPCRG